MPLNIEVTGKGPGGGLLLAISHSSVQGGDLMRDPEIVAEVTPGSSDWLPISFRQDTSGFSTRRSSARGASSCSITAWSPT
jgi:hypothetical protein